MERKGNEDYSSCLYSKRVCTFLGGRGKGHNLQAHDAIWKKCGKGYSIIRACSAVIQAMSNGAFHGNGTKWVIIFVVLLFAWHAKLGKGNKRKLRYRRETFEDVFIIFLYGEHGEYLSWTGDTVHWFLCKRCVCECGCECVGECVCVWVSTSLLGNIRLHV